MADLQTLLLANGAVAIGAAIQGTVGFGMNLIALPLLLSLNDDFIPAPLLVAHLVLVVCLSSIEWRQVDRRFLDYSLLGAVPGTALGTFAISVMSRDVFVGFTAGILILGILATAFKLHIPPTRLAILAAGAVSGLCGTTTSVNGPPLGLVMIGGSSLASIRATLAVFLMFSTIFSLAALYLAGRTNGSTMMIAGMLLPGTMAGLGIAKLWQKSVGDPLAPRRIFLGVSVLATAVFLAKEWML